MEDYGDWLTLTEASTLVNLSPAYIYILCRKGKLRAVKRAGRWFVYKPALLAYKAKMEKLGRKRFAPSKWWPKEEEEA
jgi:excisionase family DNA binding protein